MESPLLGPDEESNYYLYFEPFASARQLVDEIKFKINWDDGTWEDALFEIAFDYTPQSGDPEVSITSPGENDDILQSANIIANANGAAGVEIWGGTDSLGIFTSEPYQANWTPSVNNFGRVYVIAKAFNDDNRVSFARVPVNVIPQVVSEPAPAGINDGVNINGNEISFTLYAPAKNYVALNGSFNREFLNGELMKLSGDTLWWVSKTLENGEYFYQYNLEGTKLIADPWSKDVEWKQPGTLIESGDYQHAKTRFVVGETPFAWTDDNFAHPAIENIIVYELHVSDFAGRTDGSIGTYQEVMEKIDEGYFDSLGVNVVELMPINEFEGENSWGYNPSFYLAPETAYGIPNELKQLINKFHQHGIAVLLDVVFNHMWGSAPLFQLYQPLNDWNYRNHDYANCPYFHNQRSDWGYKLQHWQEVNGRKYRTWKYITDVLRTWVVEYHFDGFRYDVSWGVGWQGYNENGMSFYTWYMNNLNSTLIQIVEEDNANRVNTTETDAGWNFSYFHTMKANLQEISDSGHTWGDMYDLANELSFTSQGFDDHYGPLNYLESHDETRIIYEATFYQGMSYEKAIKKSKLGAVILLTGVGTPMLYAGQEFAQNGNSRNPGGGIIQQPLKWENLNTEPGLDLFHFYRRLIWLRKNYDILTSSNFAVKAKNNSVKYIVYWRGDANSEEKIVVAANFNNADHSIGIQFPNPGKWYEFTEDDSVEIGSTYLPSYSLPAATARIFVSQRDWTTVIVDHRQNTTPSHFKLLQNYPNPFSAAGQSSTNARSGTTIRYQLYNPIPAEVRLTIHNLLGQKVRELLCDRQDAGLYEVRWDGQNQYGQQMAAGIYLAMLTTNRESQIIKITLLK